MPALILKGGGVKGIAFAGALVELAPFISCSAYAGASAGAIAAVLLGAGYSPNELLALLREKDFRNFTDRWWRWPWNILARKGIHSGNPLEDWLNELLNARIQSRRLIEMEQLPVRAVMFGSTWGRATVVFDKAGDNAGTSAAFAARCSASIPVFFAPREHGGTYVFDGGLLNNFPVDECIKLLGHDFVGLYLTPEPRPKVPRSVFGQVFDILIERDYRELVDKYPDRMVVIDPSPVSTTDFSLSANDKDLLEWAGRLAARIHLKPKGLSSDEKIAEARAKVEALKKQAHVARLKRKRSLLMALAVVGLLPVLAILAFRSATIRDSLRVVLPASWVRVTEIVPPPSGDLLRNMKVLPEVIDYSAFEIGTVNTYVDFRDWLPVAAERKDQRISPVTWRRVVTATKIKPVNEMRFRIQTEGSAIDLRCNNCERYRLEYGVRPGTPATVLMTSYDMVVDVAKFPIGQEFSIETDATLWNGSANEKEDWWAYAVRAPIKSLSVTLKFPKHKRPQSQPRPVLYLPNSAVENPIPADQDHVLLFRPELGEVHWRVTSPLVFHTYELQWEW